MSIPSWPVEERPREKLLKRGPDALSDAEILSIFLRTGRKGASALDLARELLDRFKGLRALLECDQKNFARPGAWVWSNMCRYRPRWNSAAAIWKRGC